MPEHGGGRAAWWRGRRGEGYVAGQVALMALVFFGPRTIAGWPPWPAPTLWRALGSLAMLAGGALLMAGLLRLGPGLTPLPYPKDSSRLATDGAYGIVRHPMYSGGLGIAFGWALFVRGWLTLAYAIALLLWLDLKSKREERWLLEKFPEYQDYQRRVRRLIPFIR